MSDRKLDRRFLPLDVAELREVPLEGQGLPNVEGYAVVYNSLSEDLGGWREIIAPGTFDRSLQGSDLRAFYGHDTKEIIGREKPGTLKVFNDTKGLKVNISLPNTTTGRDVYENLRNGNLDGMSFAMIPTLDEWANTRDGLVCTIREALIFEVSIVSMPAYSATSVSLRCLERAKEMMKHNPNIEVLERRLKLLGY